MPHGFKATDIAWDLPAEDASERLTLLAIAKWADDGLKSYPSQEAICKATKMNIKTLGKALKRLTARGLLTVSKRGNNCNEYRLTEIGLTEFGMTKNGMTELGQTEPPKTDIQTDQIRADSMTKLGQRTYQEQITEQTSEQSKPASAKRGTRLCFDELPKEWADYCSENYPDLDPISCFDDFHDYWIGVPGKAGVKLNWFATFRNFLRNLPEWKKPLLKKEQLLVMHKGIFD